MKCIDTLFLFLITASCLFFIQAHSMERPRQPGTPRSTGPSVLHNAIVKDDAGAVGLLTATHWHVIHQDELPLHFAVRLGKIDMVRALLAHGVPVDKDLHAETALHIAARLGHYDIVVLLVGAGAHLSATRSDTMTPLHLAIRNGHGSVVSFLIEAAQSNRVVVDWEKCFALAREHHKKKIVNLLEKAQQPAAKNLGKRKDFEQTAATQPQKTHSRSEHSQQPSAAVMHSQPSLSYSTMSNEDHQRLFLWFQTNLLNLISTGDVSGLRLAVHLGVPMNVTYTNGKTALEVAAHHPNQLSAQEMVRILLPVVNTANPIDASGQVLDKIMLRSGRDTIARIIIEELMRRGEIPTILPSVASLIEAAGKRGLFPQ